MSFVTRANIRVDRVRGGGVWQDFVIDAGGLKAPGSKPATAIAHGSLEIPAWQFADAGAGNENSISFAVKMPGCFDRTTNPQFLLGWSSASTGNCKWQFEYVWRAPDEDTTAAAQETLTVVDAASSTANGLVPTTINSSDIDLPAAGDIVLHARVKRLSADAQDTITDTVELQGVILRIVADCVGEAV